jgi:hypothetical protein
LIIFGDNLKWLRVRRFFSTPALTHSAIFEIVRCLCLLITKRREKSFIACLTGEVKSNSSRSQRQRFIPQLCFLVPWLFNCGFQDQSFARPVSISNFGRIGLPKILQETACIGACI